MSYQGQDYADHLALTHFAPVTVMLAVMDKSRESPSIVVANGTGTLVDTGTSRFLVTNHHVYEVFRSQPAFSPGAALKMSGADGADFLDVSESPILGLSEARDLAVLRVEEERVLAQGKRFISYRAWPPSRPVNGTSAYISGFPGDGRRQESQNIRMRAALTATRVECVREDRFTLVDPNGEVGFRCPDGVDPQTGYGGMSGSAVYLSADESMFRLVGSMFEATPSMVAILATHADYINADGSIRE
jgi:hypothetical protein